VSSARIVYRPREDASADSSASALANVYRFVLSKSNASQKAVEPAPEPDGHDEAKEWKHGFPPAVAYLGAVEPVLERLYGRGEVAM
jgi:hypothetical protein